MRRRRRNRRLDAGDLGQRVLASVVLGATAGFKGDSLGRFVLGMAVVEKLTGVTAEDVAAAWQRQIEEERRQQRAEELRAVMQVALKPKAGETATSAPDTGLAAPTGVPVVVEPDARWRQVIIHPSVILILGRRGSGKSALGYRILELFRYGPRVYVIGVPASARSLLPGWIGIAPSLDEVPPKAIALVDEAYLHYHARGSMAQESKAMSQLLDLSRQREQTIIFVSQEARQVDRNIASSANVVVFKNLGMLQLEFDRPELNKLAAQAKEAFATVKGDRRRWSFIYAPDSDFLGLLENELPSFWKPKLSRLFASAAAPSTPRPPKRMTPQEKAQKAREMHDRGASHREIAQALDVSTGTVTNYIKGYPYRR